MKKLRDYTGKSLQDCTILELYNAALELTQDACKDKGYNSGKKKVYYISPTWRSSSTSPPSETAASEDLRPALSTAWRPWAFPQTA